MEIYKSKDSLRGVTLSFGDIICFTENIQYRVMDNYISNDDGSNQKIFEYIWYGWQLRFEIASWAYWYKAQEWCCPTCKSWDYLALTRLVEQIFERIEVKHPVIKDETYAPKTPNGLTLKLNWGRTFEAEFDKVYQVKTIDSQWRNGVIVIQDHKILMLSNYANWDGWHKLSEKNNAYWFKYQWCFGSVSNLVPWKEFNYTDIYDIAGVEATEPTPVEEMTTKTEYMKRQLIEVNEATEEPCCASTTRRKAKLVFKKIR